MSPKLMKAVQYNSYGGGASALKVMASFSFLLQKIVFLFLRVWLHNLSSVRVQISYEIAICKIVINVTVINTCFLFLNSMLKFPSQLQRPMKFWSSWKQLALIHLIARFRRAFFALCVFLENFPTYLVWLTTTSFLLKSEFGLANKNNLLEFIYWHKQISLRLFGLIYLNLSIDIKSLHHVHLFSVYFHKVYNIAFENNL